MVLLGQKTAALAVTAQRAATWEGAVAAAIAPCRRNVLLAAPIWGGASPEQPRPSATGCGLWQHQRRAARQTRAGRERAAARAGGGAGRRLVLRARRPDVPGHGEALRDAGARVRRVRRGHAVRLRRPGARPASLPLVRAAGCARVHIPGTAATPPRRSQHMMQICAGCHVFTATLSNVVTGNCVYVRHMMVQEK